MPARFDQSPDLLANSSNTFAFRIFRMDDHALYSVDQFKPTVFATLQRLRGLAPATIENGVRSRDARRRGCVLASHDADQDIDCRSGVAPRQRANFGEGFGHA